MAACLGSAVFVLSVLLVFTPATATPPDAPARMIAEWEPAYGTLIRWPLGIPLSLVRELAEDDTLYTLVEGQSSENAARNTFQGAGVNLDHVHFIRTNVYSMWTRDWGPQCIFDGNGQMGITDPWFDGYPWVPGCPDKQATVPEFPRSRKRGYDEDDVIPGAVAAELGLALFAMPAYCTGGNIMTDGHGTAFSTQQMLAENAPYMSETVFRNRAQDYLGVTEYHFLENPEVFGIQHIDCYAKLLDEETVLVKEVFLGHPEYQCVEALADAFGSLNTCYGRPYRVIRIWCASYAGNDVAAYTNSLILNRKVLVPTFDIAADEAALETYRQAMPGFEVIGFDYHSWYYYDALHCRTMGIFDAGMLRLLHRRLADLVPYAGQIEILAEIDDRSEAGLITGEQKVLWRLAGEGVWNETPLVPTVGDSFQAFIPGQLPGAMVEYFLAAADHSGRTESLPRSAPAGFYSFQIDPSTTGLPTPAFAPGLTVHPNPFNPRTEIVVSLPRDTQLDLAVFGLDGRWVTTLSRGDWPAGSHVFAWDGRDAAGRRVGSGGFLVRLQAGFWRECRKVLMLK